MPSTDFNEPPAMGERRARLGYGAQDRLAAELILDALKSPSFHAVRLADLEGGQVDDFVLVWETEVWGNSVKWTGTNDTLSWADLCGATEPLIIQLAEGWKTLRNRWPGRNIHVYLRTNRLASESNHGNQLVPGMSLAYFLTTSWDAIQRGEPMQPQFESAWERLRESSGLDEAEFWEFVHQCHILTGLSAPFHDDPESRDAKEWERQFDRLRQVINDWVASNPDKAEIESVELLRFIRIRRPSSVSEHFPEPEIGYLENEKSTCSLRAAISTHSSGYLAFVGSAGAGKSTLVSKIIQDEPFGISYFAYLPEGAADPRIRGDALEFYRYVIAVLEKWEPGVCRAHDVTDLAQANEAFARHMQRVKERYKRTGRKTLILLDGLDHVVREEGLDHPIQKELPLPQTLPEGCLILIGTQPQALDSLRVQIRTQLEIPDRRIEIDPLPPEIIWSTLTDARVQRNLSDSDQKLIVDSCAGNPLFLTYIVRSLIASPDVATKKIIAEYGTYSGDSEAYYAERFRSLLDNPDSKRILALLCRVRGRTPLQWLRTWPEWYQFEQLHRISLAAFFREEEDRLSVLHDSLISYLRRATRPQSAPLAEEAERRFHREIADRYPAGSCSDELARERLFHLVMAGEHESVLSIATIEWFREGAVALVPLDDLKDLVWTCLRSAVEVKDYGAILRLIVIAREIDQRTFVLENVELASKFWRLGQGKRALQYVLNESQLRIESKQALEFCEILVSDERADAFYIRKARQIFDLAKPVRLLYASGEVSAYGEDSLDLVKAWASIAPHFVSVPHIIETIQDLTFEQSRRDNPDERPPLLRAFLLKEALQAVLKSNSADVELLVNAIETTGEKEWLFPARLYLLTLAQSRGHDTEKPLEELRQVLEFEKVQEDMRLRLVECLWIIGEVHEAKTLLQTLELPTPSAYPENNRRAGSLLGNVEQRIEVAKLHVILDLPSLQIVPDPNPDDETVNRIAFICQEIGELWGRAILGQTPQDLTGRFERFLTFHLRGVTPVRHLHSAGLARTEIYSLLPDLAADLGDSGGQALRQAIIAVDGRSGPSVISDCHRRALAVGLRRSGALTVTEALEWVRRSISDAKVEDTAERTEAAFDIAQVLHDLGNEVGVSSWLDTAGRACLGIGGHKDYQMVSWMEWLDRSLSSEAEAVSLPVVEMAARTVEVAGGDGTSDACIKMVLLCFRRHPLIGVKLGLEMVERDLLHLSDVLEAIVPTASEMGSDSQYLSAIYSRLYLLIDPNPKGEIAASIVRNTMNDAFAQAVAQRCITGVKVNAPSDRRRSTVRAIIDAIKERGLDAPDLEAKLPPDADESPNTSSSWLYRMPDGTSRSVTGVSILLSDPDHPEQWNPNPNDNRSFVWGEAIETVSLRSHSHLEALETAFATIRSSEGDARVFAALSRAAVRFGNLSHAQHLAEHAYESARDGGWIYWLDGGYKRKSLEALIELDPERWLPVARSEFLADLLAQRMGSQFLMEDICEIFDLLRWPWPKEEVLQTVNTYFEGMTAEVTLAMPFESLTQQEEVWAADEALSYLLTELLVHPVAEVATASRSALSDGIASRNHSALRAFERLEAYQTIEIERALASIHVASLQNIEAITPFRNFVEAATKSPSAAVQSVARRICDRASWTIAPTNKTELPAIYSLALPHDSANIESFIRKGAVEIPGTGLGLTLELYRPMLTLIAHKAGIPFDNVYARAQKFYGEIEPTHSWTKDGCAKLERWKNGVPVSHYIKPQAEVARDAVMRVVSELISAGRLNESYLANYDYLLPIYVVDLDDAFPCERPTGIEGITVDWMGTKWLKWVESLDNAELQKRASHVEGSVVLAEHSVFRVPDWDTPQEERSVALVSGAISALRIIQPKVLFASHVRDTYVVYKSRGEEMDELVFRNRADVITTSAANWLALNPAIGYSMDWKLDDAGLFRWTNDENEVMVESLWWRDGWTRLKPPKSLKTLGEGWLVLCSPEAFDAILQFVGPSRFVVSGMRSYKTEESYDYAETNLTIELPLS